VKLREPRHKINFYTGVFMNALQPIYLFSDSQLLFWRQNGIRFLDSLREFILEESPKAAYIGASNGDQPEFYHLFEAAMKEIGIKNCRMILSSFSEEDQAFLEEADLILLAGGDVEQGWNVFQSIGLKEAITKKYYDGALLIGISAGAVQLGACGRGKEEEKVNGLIDTFRLVPFIIGAHEEKEEWKKLSETIQLRGGYEKGIGIPMGGGMIYHPDQTVEPIRYPLYECSTKDEQISSNLLFPGVEEKNALAADLPT